MRNGAAGGVQYLIFKSFWLALKRLPVWHEDWALGKLSLKSFGNSWGNSYIPCLLITFMLHFTCSEKKFSKTGVYTNWCLPRRFGKKSKNIMKIIVV